ncbi:unnamed protein product [Plutella xylostella]|uniref:(diamondback moth) hypothetical protein n=1 Tax=Plutella xylostella TaxID=51655 RepID=A0A8S4DAS2_PLUXY|nr:unnamed protein product [Plutella xylostella]
MSATLRTPRRRFSPRAKRRYYHIKNFLKKTLGNSSQEDSSRDKQSLYLDDKQCQDLPCLRDKSSEEVIYEGSRESKKRKPKSEYEREHESGGSARYHSECYEGDATRYLHKNTKFKSESYSIPYKEKKKRRSKHTTRYDPYDDEHPLYPAEASPHLSSSHHAATHRKTHLHLTTSGYSDLRYEKEYKRHRDLDERQSKDKKSKKKHDKHKIEYEIEHERYEEEPRRHRKGSSILDHDFIDDIIKRQYQHVTMFNSQGTVMSQISAPVCRDRDLALQESILEAHDLCSCMFDRESPRGDRRSVCDTRLYSTHKKKHRSKHCRKDKKHEDKYNDMSLDLVPVKEKSSPKPRRKIDMDSTAEVPPSPRTNRPRLNLQAHYRDDDDNDVTPSDSPRTEQCRRDQFLADQYEHNLREMELRKSYKSPERYQNEYLPTHDLHSFVDQSQNVQIEQMDTQANFVTPRDPNDHTGEALTEIKDILQTFLNEIKKDAQAYLADTQSPEVVKDHNLEGNTEPPKVIETVPVLVPSPPVTAAPAPFPAVSSQGPSTSFQQFAFNKNSPYQMTPPFSPACFPMMCPPAPYLMPGSGYTFPCVTSLHRTQSRQDNKTERASDSSKEKIETTNTDELLKQIYKIVAQNPKGTEAQKESRVVEEQKESTSDSESNGNAVSVNGPKEDKKSLQEIFNHGPDGSFESHQERFSAAATRTDSNLFDDSYKMKKRKSGIFGKIIQSIGVFGLGLFKSRSNIEERSDHGRHQQRRHKERSRSPWATRRDAIKREFEELRRQKGSRSPSPRHPPPRTPWDYNTHPAPPPLHPPPHPQHTDYNYPPPTHYPAPSPDQPPPSMYLPPPPMMYEQPQSPTAPPYFNIQQQYHMQQQQQMPFCLKEVEVKSIGTQSQVKLNIFKKFKNKKAKSPRAKWMPDNEVEPPQYNKQFMKMQQAMQMQKKQMQMQKQMQMHQKMQMRSEESTPREKSKKPFNFLENEFLKTREKVARDSEIQGDFVKTLFGKPLARGANKGPSWLKSIFEKPNFDCTKPGIKF